MDGLALVDWYNLRRRDQSTKADLELITETLWIGFRTRSQPCFRISHAFATLFPDARELDVRLYGGWTDELGWPSHHASWFHALLPNLRGRRSGLIVRPTLATSMIQFPLFLPRGTVRRRSGSRRQGHEQKMVDGMLGCDALYAAMRSRTCIGIVTDDDDLLPNALSSHERNPAAVVWMRTRRVGSATNDRALLNMGLSIHQLRS